MKAITNGSCCHEYGTAVTKVPAKAFRLAIALFALSIAVNVNAQTHLGPFSEEDDLSNPFHPPLRFPSNPGPVLADIDRDGDKDLVVGSPTSDSGNALYYYENVGTSANPVFTERALGDNPFRYLVYEYPVTLNTIRPAFGDFDKDGDLDLVVGCVQQGLRYYKNITDWSQSNPSIEFQKQTATWDFVTGVGNPFLGINFFYSAPHIVDFDGDHDDDLVLATLADSGDGNETIHLYTNDGTGVFTHSHLSGVNPGGTRLSVAVVDFDSDNDKDIITGDEDGAFKYFENTGGNTFQESTTWSVFNSFNLGTSIVPAFADLNNDGKHEAIIGSSPNSSPQSIVYLENKGSNTYEKLSGIHDPFGGIWIYFDATPYFADVDQDGDDDILFDNRRADIIYLKNNNGVYDYATPEENIFSGIVTANAFSISYIDLNGDGKRDIVGGSAIGVQYFQSTSTGFSSVPVASGPFSAITTFDYPKTDFADVDSDGDFDLFLSDATDATQSRYYVRYFENTGSATAPVFTERTGTANLLNGILEEYELYPRLADIDHDGDLDALIGEGGDVHAEIVNSNEFLFYENVGTTGAPSFVYVGDLVPQYENAEYFSPAFSDIDHDGDLDVIEGDDVGFISLYRNNNTEPVVTLNNTPIITEYASGSIYVDQELTIADSDNDLISLVRVNVSNYSQHDAFTFTTPAIEAQPLITSSFSEGVLTIKGKASLAFYQELLRTLEYHFDQSEGFARAATSKTISIEVFDADFTTPTPVARLISIGGIPNSDPVFTDASLEVVAGKSATLDLSSLISDPDNNLVMSSLKILSASENGLASVSGATLTVDYTNVIFKGSKTVNMEICDNVNACASATITVNVTNTPPAFLSTSINLTAHQQTTFQLSELINDDDNNIDGSSLTVVALPASGAEISVNEAAELLVNYSTTDFTGTETITLKVCDFGGDCAESVVTIHVLSDEEVIVFNAVAPKGSSELNQYLHVANLPSSNKVTIFNRWGDEVYKVSGYSNDTAGRRFEGYNKNGNALPSGTYFYKVEYQKTADNGAIESKVLTGYLSLQQ